MIDLDAICGPYRRILFSQRILRAATASLAGFALLAAPRSLFFAIYDFGAPVFGVIAGILLTVFLALVGALYFSWMRALWRGSVRAGKIGLLVTVLAAIGVATSVTRLNRELFVTGEIWFHLTAHALQLSALGVMGMGSAIVVRRRRDVTLNAQAERQAQRHAPARHRHRLGDESTPVASRVDATLRLALPAPGGHVRQGLPLAHV